MAEKWIPVEKDDEKVSERIEHFTRGQDERRMDERIEGRRIEERRI